MKINAIKANGVEYDIWSTSAEVEALNNQGNAALGKELSSGKQSIVDAINNVGGEASEEESLSELAEDIEQMPIVNVSAFKFSEVPNLAKIMLERNYTGLQSILFSDSITEVEDESVTSLGQYALRDCPNLIRVILPNADVKGGALFRSHNIKYITVASSSYSLFSQSGYDDGYSGNYPIVELIITAVISNTLDNQSYYKSSRYPSLIKFGVPQGTDGYMTATKWTASTYLVNSADQWENRLTLYQNLLAYTINRLYDHSQDGVTRTFRLGFYATLFADSQLNTEPYGSYYTPLIKAAAQACIDEATRRGWTLSA